MSRTRTRGLTALAVGGLTSLTMITPAQAIACPAGTYPPGVQCTPVAITVTSVVAGQSFTVTVTGFKAGSAVTFVLHSAAANLGTFTANASGSVTASLTVPSGFAAGAHTLTASGVAPDGSARILSAPLTVKASGSSLPFTGFELGAASLLGAGLLGAGTLAVMSGRKRKTGLAAA